MDAIHPAGRKLFGRLVVEELSEYSRDNSVFGFIIGNIYAEAPALASSSPYINVGILNITDDPVRAIGLSPEEFEFMAMRTYYPHETATSDMQFSNQYYDGEYNYSNNSLNYFGGLSNTPMRTIAAARTELMPDPITYQFPFRKEKAQLWLSGSSKTTQESESAYLEGGLTDSKLKIAHNQVFSFDKDFSVKIEFRPEEAVNKALIAKSGSGFYTTGTDDELWGGSGTAWPSTLTGRTWGIGFSASRQVYVNIFDVSDDNPNQNGIHTYTHTSVLALNDYHCVLFSYTDDTALVSITVDGVTQTFTHVGDVNDSITPITFGSTYHVNPQGRSLTFLGGLRNAGIWNRIVEPTEYPLLANKNYQSLKAMQKHGLLFFSNLNNPFLIDETGYNHIIEHFYAPGDAITQCFDQLDNVAYNQQAKTNVTHIEDITFWRGVGLTAHSCFAPTVYQSTGWKQENLVRASMNLLSSHWLNITPIHRQDKVIMRLNSGGPQVYNLIPDVHLVETGTYILKFDIQNNIRNAFGNVKGFRIVFDGSDIAELYKINTEYVLYNTSFIISPDGNWIHCTCTLDLTGADPNGKFWIRMLTTDSTTAYDNFVSIDNNDIALRNFHLYRLGTEDTAYLETKNVPKVSGQKTPSILFGDYQDGYDFASTKLNIQHKAIFCVCTNDATIIDGPDYRLTTSDFTSNRNATPITVSLNSSTAYEKRLIRAYHKAGVIQIYRKYAELGEEIVADAAANAAASTGNQTYTLFAECINFKMYDLIVLDNPTDYEINATTQYLINKHGLA